jgi:hypothetical protein
VDARAAEALSSAEVGEDRLGVGRGRERVARVGRVDVDPGGGRARRGGRGERVRGGGGARAGSRRRGLGAEAAEVRAGGRRRRGGGGGEVEDELRRSGCAGGEL